MKTTTKPRALIYCRVSTTGQEEKGTSLESQAAACKDFAKVKGYHIEETVKEVFSGAYLFDRPRLNECRAKLRTGAYDAVIVYAIDRLSRDVAHLAIIADEVERAGAELHFVTEDLDKTAEGKLMLSVKSYVGEVERLKIRERCMRGKRTKAEKGILVAPSCDLYGYRLNKATGLREVIGSEAAIVENIFKEIANGTSIRALVRSLNASGVASPGTNKKKFSAAKFSNLSERGKTLWGNGVIHRILTNIAYTGKTYSMRYAGETGYANGKRINRITLKDQSEWIELPDNITPAIIESELFERVQQRLKDNRAGNKTRNEIRPSLLRGLFYCNCGRKYHPTWSKDYYSFRCSSWRSMKCGQSLPVNGKVVESLVWGRVTEILTNPEIVMLELEQRQEVNHFEREEVQRQLKSAENQLTDITRELNKLVERMGKVDDSIFDLIQKQINEKTKERNRVQKIVSDAQSRLAGFNAEAKGVASLVEYCNTFAGDVDNYGFDEKRTILDAMAVTVTGDRNKLDVTLGIPTVSELMGGCPSVPNDRMLGTKGQKTEGAFTITFRL